MPGLFDSLFSDRDTRTTSSTQTGQSSFGLTPDVLNYWQSISGQFGPQNWTPVGPDQYQTAAAQSQAGYASGLNPAFGAATGIAQNGISTGDINRFMSPYTQNVVDATRQNFADQNAQDNTINQAQAAKLGALSGTNPIVARQLATERQRSAQDPVIAGLYEKGYQQAADMAARSAQTQLGGVGAASGVAGQQAGINQGQFGMGSQFWNQNWQNQNQPLNWATQGAQTLASLIPGSGQTSSGSSTGTTTSTATPSLFSVGTGLLGAAFAGGWQPFGRKDGGRIEMASGGAVSKPSDPHEKFVKAFDTISGLISRAKGGSVMKPYAGGGEVVENWNTPLPIEANPPAVGQWGTAVKPASSGFNWAKAGENLMKRPQRPAGDGLGSALSADQASLSNFMSGLRPRFDDGGAVEWGERGPMFPEVASASGLSPMMRLGAPVERPELPSARMGYPSNDAELFNAIKGFEGFRPKAYGDYKQTSVGYGTRATSPDEVISQEEAERRLATEVLNARRFVDEFAPDLDPGTRAALTSLTYNTGTDWQKAGLGNAVRAGNMPEARRLFLQYTKAGGQDLPGLIKRRQAEAEWGFGGGSGIIGVNDPEGARLAASMRPAPEAAREVRVASADPVAASSATSTDAPKEKSWLDYILPGRNEGVWAGQALTPMQRAGVALMSLPSPRYNAPFAGPANAIMALEQNRMKEREIDNRVSELMGSINGQPTLAARQLAQQTADAAAQRKQAADLALGTVGGQPTLAARQAEVGMATDKLAQEAAQLKLDEQRNPERLYERRAVLADKYGLTGDNRMQFIFDGKIPDRTAATETTEQKEISKTAVEMAQKNIQAAQGAQDTLRIVDELRELPKTKNFEAAIGPVDQSTIWQSIAGVLPLAETLGLANPKVNAHIQRLQSQLTLAGGEKMKGLGAQSDADAARLEKAVSNLGSARDKTEFYDALRIIEESVINSYNRGVASAKKFPKLNEELAGKDPREVMTRRDQALKDARDIISKGASRDKVYDELRRMGIDPKDL